MKFTELPIHPDLIKAVAAMGFDKPTPIQQQAIPPALEGKDLVGSAQTGSGKTVAFALPLLNRLLTNEARSKKTVRAVILVPVRELAAQVEAVLAELGVAPAETLHVGDSLSADIGGAAPLGIRTAWITRRIERTGPCKS